MAGKRGGRKTRKVEIDLTEFGNIVEATQDRTLSEEERKVLRDAQGVLARLAATRNNETSAAVLGEQADAISVARQVPACESRFYRGLSRLARERSRPVAFSGKKANA